MDSINTLLELNKASDLVYLKNILDTYYQKEPTFHNNSFFIKLYQKLSNIKDLTLVPEEQKNYFLTLFSKGLGKNISPIENKTIIKQDFFVFLELEQKLLDIKINTHEKISILQQFIDAKAIPETSTLSYLFNQKNYILKRIIIQNFASLIEFTNYLSILLNRNSEYEELRLIALKFANLRQDLPQEIFERIINDVSEPQIIRLTAIDLYHSVISQKTLDALVLNKDENLDLRLICLRKIFLRPTISPTFFATLFLDKNENLIIKKNLIIIFKNRIPLNILREYFLYSQINNAEKYELLKLLTDVFEKLNQDGSLDMLFILMREHKLGQKLLLKSNVITNETLKKILLDSVSTDNQKREAFEYLEKILTRDTLLPFILEILSTTLVPVNIKKYLIVTYQRDIPLEILVKIIANKHENLNLRIDIIKIIKNELIKKNKVNLLDCIFKNIEESIILINFILKNFYSYLDEKIVASYLLNQPLNEHLRNLLLSLKKVNFLTPSSYYFSKILKGKNLAVNDLTFFRDNFLDYFSAEDIFLLLHDSIKEKNCVTFIKSLTLPEALKSKFLYFIFEKSTLMDNIKLRLLQEFIISLPTDVLLKLLTAAQTSLDIKTMIIKNNPKRADLNLKGDLNFIILDKNELLSIKSLIVKEYYQFLSPDILKAFESVKP
ncbi:MAG: hypothetical protein WC860_01080 [Candidatus Margulisiibacteriota bacterium]|jgi:hypothetical protein